MKKNKLLMYTLMFSAFMSAANIKANAQIEYDNTIKLETNIDKWSLSNDLIYHKVDDRENNWFTKNVYLKGYVNNVETVISLGNNDNNDTTIPLGSTRASDGSWNTSKGAVINYGFDEGTRVKLIEEYTFKNMQNVSGKIKYKIDTYDYLSLSFKDNYEGDKLDGFVNNIKGNYGKIEGTDNTNNHMDIYLDCVYDSDNVSSENRRLVCSVSSDESEKISTINSGTITLPTYSLFTDLNVSGNAIPSGNFAINSEANTISDNSRKAVLYASTLKNGTNWSFVESTGLLKYNNIGSTTESVISNDNYALLNFNELKEFYEGSVVEYLPTGEESTWRSVDRENYTNEDGTVTNMPGLDDDTTNTGNSYGTSDYTQTKSIYDDLTRIGNTGANYSVTLTYNDKSNLPIPTGIIYEIIPYIIIAILSSIGIVIIKKNKIKDESNK